MTKGTLPPENTLDDVKVKIRKSYKSANVRTITQAVLKEGPKAFRIATLLEIINPQTKEFHHYSLKIDHINKLKAGWFAKPERSVRLEGTEPDEIRQLQQFLNAAYEHKFDNKTGELHLISGKDYEKLENILDVIPNIADTDKLQLVGNILSQLDDSASTFNNFVKAFEGSKPETLSHIAAASRMIEYSKSVNVLKTLIENPSSKESDFQTHLNNNAWMFGSEYSELLSRRTWTRDDSLDYMLRKTVDDYLEIVEIKTAFNDALFLHDSSHDSYYPSAKLSKVIGQVTRYIEEVERNRDCIMVKDGTDTLKIRARVIVGRDGNQRHQEALRNFNAHLNRIEIITYDQLVKIAERVLNMFNVEVPQDLPFDDLDIPF